MNQLLEPELTYPQSEEEEHLSDTSLSLPEPDDPEFNSQFARQKRTTLAAEDTSEAVDYYEPAFDLWRLFESAREELFEDGMESDFSQKLMRLILCSPHDALSELALLLESTEVSSEASAEALRWIGRLRDPESQPHRLWLLERSLGNPNPAIRDAAIVGLAALDDRRSKKYVAAALATESVPELREDLKQLLEQFNYPEKWYALSPQVHSEG